MNLTEAKIEEFIKKYDEACEDLENIGWKVDRDTSSGYTFSKDGFTFNNIDKAESYEVDKFAKENGLIHFFVLRQLDANTPRRYPEKSSFLRYFNPKTEKLIEELKND